MLHTLFGNVGLPVIIVLVMLACVIRAATYRRDARPRGMRRYLRSYSRR